VWLVKQAFCDFWIHCVAAHLVVAIRLPANGAAIGTELNYLGEPDINNDCCSSEERDTLQK
jgi:hypothetical protein